MMQSRLLIRFALFGAGCVALTTSAAAQPVFVGSETCVACHNQLTTPAGRDVSMGFDWRPSMMANASRDPYWQGAVRREIMDHPQLQAAIEDECSACHMPMTRHRAQAAGRKGEIFAHLPIGQQLGPRALLAADGVSCSLCHQITGEKLGTAESFTAGFVVDATRPLDQRRAFGPYAVEPGLERVMRSATGFVQTKSEHVQSSELCATCHTLYTHARGPDGKVVGKLPEQVPYLEWKHSDYSEAQSCQSCHMPVVDDKLRISSVLGEPRAGFSRHTFNGANFLMPRILNLYRAELGVQATPQELDAQASRTLNHVQSAAAALAIENLRVQGGALAADVVLTNLAGHKLPTAYPSRRVWLEVRVRDASGRVLLESGVLEPNGAIVGNDNDADPARYEPHHDVIDGPDAVQIYESIMVDLQGKVTTGLLSGVCYIKDNRVLPTGFDKGSAPADIAVQGAAAQDADFLAETDRVTYRAQLGEARWPLRVDVTLWYQPISFRWAHNLAAYQAPEPQRMVRYFKDVSTSSAAVLARTSVSFTPSAPATAPAEQPPAE